LAADLHLQESIAMPVLMATRQTVVQQVEDFGRDWPSRHRELMHLDCRPQLQVRRVAAEPHRSGRD
jgi:hypothetical protein